MKPWLCLCVLGLWAGSVAAQTPAWRCVINGRVVYQQDPCGGRLVGERDRRTEAQKRADQQREREKASAPAAAGASAAPAAAGASSAPGSASAPAAAAARGGANPAPR